MEKNKEMSTITIHAHDEEEAHRLVSAVFQGEQEGARIQEKPVKSSSSSWSPKSIFKNVGSILYLAVLWILRFVLFLLKTPFYIWFFIRNFIATGIIVGIGYFIVAYSYYSFSGQYEAIRNSDAVTATLFSDTKGMILLGVVTVLAALVTFEEIREDF